MGSLVSTIVCNVNWLAMLSLAQRCLFVSVKKEYHITIFFPEQCFLHNFNATIVLKKLFQGFLIQYV